LGILNPMVIEDLNKEIQEEHTDPELIREALKEAVFNRKTNWNYIKGVLRNWKLSGITTKIQVEERRLEHQGKKQHHQVSDDFKTGMDAARQLWGGQ
jgi:DNA replication protein